MQVIKKSKVLQNVLCNILWRPITVSHTVLTVTLHSCGSGQNLTPTKSKPLNQLQW